MNHLTHSEFLNALSQLGIKGYPPRIVTQHPSASVYVFNFPSGRNYAQISHGCPDTNIPWIISYVNWFGCGETLQDCLIDFQKTVIWSGLEALKRDIANCAGHLIQAENIRFTTPTPLPTLKFESTEIIAEYTAHFDQEITITYDFMPYRRLRYTFNGSAHLERPNLSWLGFGLPPVIR